MANLVNFFLKILEMWQIWWIFFFTNENPLRGAWLPPPFQVVTLEYIFSTFFFTVLRKSDWNVQLCERNHGLVFWGTWRIFLTFGVWGGFGRLCAVLCCVRAEWKESLLFLLFPFLSSSRVATNCGVTHACILSLARSPLPCTQQQLERLLLCPPQPAYLRTEHINKRRKEPLETES